MCHPRRIGQLVCSYRLVATSRSSRLEDQNSELMCEFEIS
jgi:hypothetical protein